MRVKYAAAIAILSILGLAIARIGYTNSKASINSTTTMIASTEKQANPCAGKPNPCAGKPNPCAGKLTATRHPQFYNENGMALDGQDVVAYFTQAKVVNGSKQFKHVWGGQTWLFASAQHRDLFAQNPEKYAPQYGGYCALAASEGNLAATQPDAWKIVDGKLYLNYDKTVQAQWMEDIPGRIAAANKNWTAILSNEQLHR